MPNHEADTKADAEKALRRRMLTGEPATYGELGGVATRAGGGERDADRYLQKLRRKGWATFARIGGRVWWTLTETGRTQLTPIFQTGDTSDAE